MQGPTRSSAAALSIPLLVGGVLVFWLLFLPGRIHPAPATGPSLVAWDLYSYFLPKFRFGTEELWGGHLPLWNRYEFAGIPFLATAQPAAAYLPKLLVFAMLSEERALITFLAAHHLLVALGMLALLRRAGIGPLGALTGGSYVALATPVLLSLYHPSRLASLAWTPLLFAAAESLGRGGGARALVGLALATGMQLTAGYPEITLDCLLLLGVLALARLATRTWSEPAHRVLPALAAGAGLGFLVAGVQTFPLAALGLQAERAALAERAIAFFRQPGMTRAAVATAMWSFPALAGIGLGAVGRRTATAPAVTLTVCLALIAFVWPWLRILPGYSMARTPLVWSWVGSFLLGWLVAEGTDRLASDSAAPSRLARSLVGVFAAALVVQLPVALLLGRPLVSAIGLSWTPYLVHGAAIPPGQAGTAALVAAGLGGAFLAVAAFAGRRGFVAPAVALLVVSQIAAFPFGSPLPPLTPADTPFRVARLLGRIPGADDGRVLSIPDIAGGWQLRERIENLLGAEYSILPPRFARVLDRLRVDLFLGKVDWDAVARGEGFLDALDVGWVVAPKRLTEAFAAHGLDRTGGTAAHLALYANRDPGTRAQVVYAATVLPAPEAALARVLDPSFDPRSEVVLEEAPAGRYPTRASRPPAPAIVRRDGPTRVEVTTETADPGLLVLADACFPGWNATIDDRPAPILCANVLTRAVELPPGRHVVRFEYQAPGLSAGVAATAGALGLCILLLARARRPGGTATVQTARG